MDNSASLQLIRNATLILNYAGKRILVDPMFFPKAAFDPIAGKERNPIVALPIPVDEIIKEVDLVLVTHTHPDHFDPIASETLNKSIKLFNQPADEAFFQQANFSNAATIHDQLFWSGITFHRTGGKHGSGAVLEHMGTVSGFVLKEADQPTIYIVGDSIWNEEVEEVIKKFQPDVIVVNSGGAYMPGFDTTPILMTEDQVVEVVKASGSAKVIAVHMDALDHCRTTRVALSQNAAQAGISTDQLIIPQDGEQVLL